MFRWPRGDRHHPRRPACHAWHTPVQSAGANRKSWHQMGIALGSAAQIALFVAPVLVLLSYVIGPTPMSIQFWRGAVVMILIATICVAVGGGDIEAVPRWRASHCSVTCQAYWACAGSLKLKTGRPPSITTSSTSRPRAARRVARRLDSSTGAAPS